MDTFSILKLKQDRGSALIGTIVIGLVILAGIASYAQWSLGSSRGESHRMATQRALQYADSGVNVLSLWLSNPDLSTQLPISSSAVTVPSIVTNGRVETSLYRNSADPSLVDTFTTAYYYIQSGSVVDPQTGQNAQIAVINAKFRITSVSQFMAAVPGSLTVDYGTNIADGIIYARDLVLTTGTVMPNTQISTAWYYNTVNSTAPQGVVFTGTDPAPQKLSFPPNFVRLDASVRSFYSERQSAQPLPAFEGTVGPAADSHVYFVTGDLDIAQTQPLIVSGVYVIYVTSNIYIHNAIVPADANSWVGIMAEKDIHLAADMPTIGDIAINGNFVANWNFIADGPMRTMQQLQFNGGIVSYEGLSLSSVWTSRRYSYHTVGDSNLLLPNFSSLIEYRVLKGKFNQ